MTERLMGLMRDMRRVRKGGPVAVTERQRDRLAELLAYARANSPYYRSLYEDLPERITDLSTLPVTGKPELMLHFDDWATDRGVTLEGVRAFVDDPSLVGQKFMDRYSVVTTSGTTGHRGIFVQDDRMFNVLTALSGRATGVWLTGRDYLFLLKGGGRGAVVYATGGHFAGYATISRLHRERPSRRRRLRVFDVQAPLGTLVAGLDDFRPAMLNGYAGALSLLATEQEERRLAIHPVLVVTSAEDLPEGERNRMAAAFGAKVRDQYSCSEFMGLAHGCEHEWLHVNADWVVLEPVEADHSPTPPGEASHTVLLTNLANRVQPLIRYDLGDSVTLRRDTCPCGSPLPAIRIRGRSSDVLEFMTQAGRRIRIPPLAIGTLLDRTPGIALFQVIQQAPDQLLVRVQTAPDAQPDRVWNTVHTAITDLLVKHDLGHVGVDQDNEAPHRSAGGKLRTVYSTVQSSDSPGK